ncbi:MAG: CRTAC1 family protein [Planctomycetaceae bacterium]
MKTFVIIIGLGALALIGFVTVVVMMPEKLPPAPTAETSGIVTAGPGAPIVPPLEYGVELSPETQLAVWNQEHTAFQIQRRFGPRLASALDRDNKDQLLQLIEPSVEASVLTSESWTETQHGQFIRRVRANSERKVGTDQELADALLKNRSLVDGAVETTVKVLEVSEAGENTWQCRLHVALKGTTAAAKPITVESEHSVTFRFEDKSQLERGSTIVAWSIEQQSTIQNDGPVAKEAISLAKSILLNSLDNWRGSRFESVVPEQIIPHRLQIAAADYDGDGDDDIAVTTGNGKRIVLRNENRQFVFATASLGIREDLPILTWPPPCLWFDMDNDGDLDLLSGIELFRNDGEKFVDVTSTCGVRLGSAPTGVVAGDYDCDGRLDLYVTLRGFELLEGAAWTDGEEGMPNRLFRGIGDGQFEDVTDAANAGAGVKASTGAVWFFANDDHYPDLVIANELSESTLLINNGDGTFKDVSSAGWTTRQTGFSGGVTAGDMNNDGRSDLYFSGLGSWVGRRVTDSLKPADFEKPELLEQIRDLASGNRMLRQTGSGEFENVTDSVQLNTDGWGFGTALVDIDNDGWLDVYASSGFRTMQPGRPNADSSRWRRIVTSPSDAATILPKIGPVDDDLGEIWSNDAKMTNKMRLNLSSFQPNRLFINDGGDDFIDVTSVSGLDLPSDSRSIIPIDLNKDNAVDLLVASAGGGAVRGFTNLITGNHSVKIQLIGKTSNRFGVGSRVTATIGDRTIVRDLFPGSGFMANGSYTVWVGTGEATMIDKLTVRWPTGETQSHENLAVDQDVEITEGEADLKTISRPASSETQQDSK